MKARYWIKSVVATAFYLLATNCSHELDLQQIKQEEFSENFKALIMGGKTIDPLHDWSTVATTPVTVSVDFANDAEYTVYIYMTPPLIDAEATYIGMAKLKSGEQKTINIAKPSNVGLLYAACYDEDNHAMCKPFVAKVSGTEVSFTGRIPSETVTPNNTSSQARTRSNTTGNNWSVPTQEMPDLTKYTTGNLIEMTEDYNEPGHTDGSEAHLKISSDYIGRISCLSDYTNQSVYVNGTWTISFDQRVINGNVIVVGNGGKIVIPEGFKLSTNSINETGEGGMIYILPGGEITGNGTLEIGNLPNTFSYNQGYITCQEIYLTGGTLYNYGTLGRNYDEPTFLTGNADNNGNSGLLINFGTAVLTQAGGNSFSLYNAAALTVRDELLLSSSSRMDDASYIGCNTLTLKGNGDDVLYMGNAAHMNCMGNLYVDNFGVWGPSGSGYKSNAIFRVNNCTYCQTTDGVAATYLLDHVELILPTNFPSIFDKGAIREWDSDIKAYGIGNLTPTYQGYWNIYMLYHWLNAYEGALINVDNYQWNRDDKNTFAWNGPSSPGAQGIDDNKRTCIYAHTASYTEERVGFYKSSDNVPATNYTYFAFEIFDDNKDFDYNDVVIRLSTPVDNGDSTFTSTAQIVAVGTGLSTTVLLNEIDFGKEIHVALGTASTANTSTMNRNFRNLDEITFNSAEEIDLSNLPFTLRIINDNDVENQLSGTARYVNGIPSYLVISGDALGKWQWPIEGWNIGLAYPLFNAWASDEHSNTDWYFSGNAGNNKTISW
ncbi:MAG: DUF4842 domain-containing protein [Prevotella sp.]|nr:DUF4842 domain-containing protein [Prevotella sp.]